jgi:hypothetical protein
MAHSGQAMTIYKLTVEINSRIADSANRICGLQVIDADQFPVPSVSDVDQVFVGQNQNIFGYGVNREIYAGGAVVDSWQFLTPQGTVIATTAFNPSSVTSGGNFPVGAGKWASFTTETSAQIALVSQSFAVVDGVNVTRWDGSCGNYQTQSWDEFFGCLQDPYVNYTAQRLCQGY